MTNCRVILLTILISCSTCNSNAQGEGASIKGQGNEFVLTLPKEMEAALERFNPKFKTWESGDYTATVSNAVRHAANPRQAPFALIVDANRDGIPDVILDGHDDRNSLLICVLSQTRGYEAVVLSQRDLDVPRNIVNVRDGKKENGFDYYLSDSHVWSSEPDFDKDKTFVFQIVYPQQSDARGGLLNDGGSISYYFEDGKFREGDFDTL